MSLLTDLKMVRDAIADGANWLDAMLAVDDVTNGNKRFVGMYEVLADAGPRRSNSLSLADFFLRMSKEQVAGFFDAIIDRPYLVEVEFPTFPRLGMPVGVSP